MPGRMNADDVRERRIGDGLRGAQPRDLARVLHGTQAQHHAGRLAQAQARGGRSARGGGAIEACARRVFPSLGGAVPLGGAAGVRALRAFRTPHARDLRALLLQLAVFGQCNGILYAEDVLPRRPVRARGGAGRRIAHAPDGKGRVRHAPVVHLHRVAAGRSAARAACA